jgi:hypothetical protein
VEIVLIIAQIVALVSVSALCIYLITVLGQFRRDVSDFTQRSRPVLDNLATITENLKSASGKIDDQVDIFKGSLQSLRDVADNVLEFERRIQDRIEEPVVQVASVLGTIVNGLASFIKGLRR